MVTPVNILLIVDMQTGFSSSRNPTVIRGCQQLILNAKKTKCKIIVLEYKDFGITLDSIKKSLGNYRTKYITKKDDDGSKEVYTYIKKNKWVVNKITVCGVCLTACVKETSEGLAELGYSISVIKKACDKPFWYHPDHMPNHKNLTLVK